MARQRDRAPDRAGQGPYRVSSGGRIRTYDLWVMSPASYRAAPPRAVARERRLAVVRTTLHQPLGGLQRGVVCTRPPVAGSFPPTGRGGTRPPPEPVPRPPTNSPVSPVPPPGLRSP